MGVLQIFKINNKEKHKKEIFIIRLCDEHLENNNNKLYKTFIKNIN